MPAIAVIYDINTDPGMKPDEYLFHFDEDGFFSHEKVVFVECGG